MEVIYDQKVLEQDIEINRGRPYQRCSISLMDTIADPDITFDETGVCNYYNKYLQAEKNRVKKGLEGERAIQQMVKEVKTEGKNKKYDCIAGISGGVDSTYCIMKAVEWGLRPLIVHFDNGWNSELANNNIENIIKTLGIDLFTYVVNWEEFRDLQRSYIKASVVDIEVPTDHAIAGTLFRLAQKHGIKYMLSGSNVVTEEILPPSWIFNKSDHVNLKAIHNKYGAIPLKTYPLFNTKLKFFNARLKGIKYIKPLNLLDFNKARAKEEIKEKLGWRDYGGKHYESLFTKFYQAYILPKKFNIDKRKAHLSNLIFSKQLTLNEAVVEIQQPLYNQQTFREEKEYVLKKLQFSENEFDQIMKAPRVEHAYFPVEQALSKKFPVLKPFSFLINKIVKR